LENDPERLHTNGSKIGNHGKQRNKKDEEEPFPELAAFWKEEYKW
jgi:hypothetical protein